MKFFKPWLQDYIIETLPEDEVIETALNKKAFEVEEIIITPQGTVFDIKVLPNRAHDALGHHGMAYELCASLGLIFKKDTRVKDREDFYQKDISAPHVTIDDTIACTRFMSMRIDNVVVGESPLWLKERLSAIGQRSINNIVDITNYVQFSLNKPMHAYDTRSISGTLCARMARDGETLVTLDDKSLTLSASTLVIADDEKILGLAGIKGGKFSGIQPDTTSVILESANFEPTRIRKTAQKYDIRTDASKRFENGIANSLLVEGLHMTANLIKDICSDAKKSLVTDIYPSKDTFYEVGISKKELNDILGTQYDDTLIQKTLKQLSFPYEVIVPHEYITNTYPTLIGAGYKRDSSMRVDAPTAFSCSSLISYLYRGIWMPSISIDKYVFCKKIKEEDMRFGDLIFSNTGEGVIRYESVNFIRGTKVEQGIDHVALYARDGMILHATKVPGMVVEESLEDHKKGRTITGYGRIVEDLHEERYVVRVPSVRLDIRIKEDLAEEIGRIIGYDTITPTLPSLNRIGLLHKRVYYENKIRALLHEGGFSEVMTYTFGNEGDVELKKGLADDKEKLRSNLSHGIQQSLVLNLYNAPLLGQKTIKIFEIGNVFTENKESRHLAIALDDGAKKSNFTEEVDMVLAGIKRALCVTSIEYETSSVKPYIIECDIDALIATLTEPTTYELSLPTAATPLYKTISPYPFITRDIAMWVPPSISWESLSALCAQVGNPLVARIDLFDTFSKEIEGIKKTSYAFRLVFQSYEKTLTDDEVNIMMEPYYQMFKEKGYEIR